MAECEGMAYVTEDGDLVAATVAPNEVAVMANAILLGSQGHVVPRGSWTEDMVRGAYADVMRGLGRIAKVKITTVDN